MALAWESQWEAISGTARGSVVRIQITTSRNRPVANVLVGHRLHLLQVHLLGHDPRHVVCELDVEPPSRRRLLRWEDPKDRAVGGDCVISRPFRVQHNPRIGRGPRETFRIRLRIRPAAGPAPDVVPAWAEAADIDPLSVASLGGGAGALFGFPPPADVVPGGVGGEGALVEAVSVELSVLQRPNNRRNRVGNAAPPAGAAAAAAADEIDADAAAMP